MPISILNSGAISYNNQLAQLSESNSVFTLIPLISNIEKNQVLANKKTLDILNEELNLNFKNVSDIKAFKNIQFSIQPYYCPSDKEGNCKLEEEGDYLNEMNQWANNPKNDSIFKVKWSFSAYDLKTKKEQNFPIRNRLNQEENLQIIGKSDRFKISTIQIHLLNPNQTVYRITATANITDVFGNKGSASFIFYSHEYNDPPSEIKPSDKSKLLKQVTESLGLSYEELFAKRWASRESGKRTTIYRKDSVRPDFEELKYQVVLNYYEQIFQDNIVSIEELKGLTRSIQQIRRLKEK